MNDRPLALVVQFFIQLYCHTDFMVAHNCHGKTKSRGTTNFTYGKTMLPDGKTKLTHGKTKLTHGRTQLIHRKTKLTRGKTKFTRGKTKLHHGKTKKTSWSAVGQRLLFAFCNSNTRFARETAVSARCFAALVVRWWTKMQTFAKVVVKVRFLINSSRICISFSSEY